MSATLKNCLLLVIAIAARTALAVPAADPAPEPQVKQSVIEDDNARIEELRVRGQTQKITVKPKNAPEYEILMGDGSRELSPGPGSTRAAAGQRVWRLLDF
jgi:hypothetical protein